MKKGLILLLSFFLVSTGIQAQAYKKQLKNVGKSVAKFNKDPEKNAAKMDEAMTLLDEIMGMEGAKSDPKVLNAKGKLYGSMINTQIINNLTDPTKTLTNPGAAVTACSAYMDALSNASDNKGAKKEAIKGLTEVQRHLDNVGIILYNAQDYKNSFANFSKVLELHDLLGANGATSMISDDAILADKLYSTAAMGLYGEQLEAATPYFEKLYAMDSNEALVYEGLYKIKGDVKYLDEGRVKFPADKGLLFAKINHELNAGNLDAAKTSLEAAIKEDPDNVSVYVTAGSVAEKIGDTEAAMSYYNQGLAKDPENFDAIYSLGAMHYNEAAGMTEEINKYANDFSKAGTAKYNELKKTMDSKFDLALPFFLKAEGINGKDVNTLIALKEIYARKNDMTKAGEYKTKIDAANN